MMQRLLMWFRRVILRSEYYAYSRRMLEQKLKFSENAHRELAHDLRLACMHGLWRRDHPLSAKNVTRSRFTYVPNWRPAPVKALADGTLHPLNTDAPDVHPDADLATLRDLSDKVNHAIEYIESGGILLTNGEPDPNGAMILGNFQIKSLANSAQVCDTPAANENS